MPAAEPSSTQAPGSDDHDLAAFGYKPSLDRSIGEFAGFATGVSYISIPHRHVPALLLFGFGFGFGAAGPAYLWSYRLDWPAVR